MITTAGVTHSQAVGVSPRTRWTRDGRRSTAAGKDGLARLDGLVERVARLRALEQDRDERLADGLRDARVGGVGGLYACAVERIEEHGQAGHPGGGGGGGGGPFRGRGRGQGETRQGGAPVSGGRPPPVGRRPPCAAAASPRSPPTGRPARASSATGQTRRQRPPALCRCRR